MTSDVKIGDVEVYIDYSDGNGERFLGQTLGGAEFTVERSFEDLLTDKHGSAAIDKVLTGNKIMVKAYLAEPSKENISRAIPEGVHAEGVADSKVGLGSQTGKLMSDYAGILRMHPRANAPADRDEDIYLWKAVSVESVTLPFKIDEQRILEVTFEALVDESKPDGFHLGQIGDSDIS